MIFLRYAILYGAMICYDMIPTPLGGEGAKNCNLHLCGLLYAKKCKLHFLGLPKKNHITFIFLGTPINLTYIFKAN
jgi:hypothetical protein